MTLEELNEALERATLDGEPTYLDVFTECEPRLLDAWIARKQVQGGATWTHPQGHEIKPEIIFDYYMVSFAKGSDEKDWCFSIPESTSPKHNEPVPSYTTYPAASAVLLDEMADGPDWKDVHVIFHSYEKLWSVEIPKYNLTIWHTNRNTAIAIAWAVRKMQGRES